MNCPQCKELSATKAEAELAWQTVKLRDGMIALLESRVRKLRAEIEHLSDSAQMRKILNSEIAKKKRPGAKGLVRNPKGRPKAG